jgi:hypothetical protein
MKPSIIESSTAAARTVAERMAAVRDAVANQRLEGLAVDAQTVADLERAARGELDVEEVLASIHARIARGEI